MKNLLNSLKTKEFKLNTKKDGIHQSERNALRSDLLNCLVGIISEYFKDETYRTEDGVSVNLQNDDLGAIPVIFSVKIPSLDYDCKTMSDEYSEKLEDKARKKAEKLAKTKEK